MSEEQTIIYPTVCLGCKAARIGIQEQQATYACGTTININLKERTLSADRSQTCLQGAPASDGSSSTHLDA